MKTSDSLLKAIKQAINDEAVGESIYQKAGQDANEVSVKKFFEKMANEEKQHIMYLKKLYEYMDKKTNTHDLIQDVRYNYNPSKEIFSKEFLDDIKKQDTLLLSLNKSAKLEENAIKFYENCKEMTSDQPMKEFFAAMAVWETSHLNKILDIFENLDDEDINYKQDDF